MSVSAAEDLRFLRPRAAPTVGAHQPRRDHLALAPGFVDRRVQSAAFAKLIFRLRLISFKIRQQGLFSATHSWLRETKA